MTASPPWRSIISPWGVMLGLSPQAQPLGLDRIYPVVNAYQHVMHGLFVHFRWQPVPQDIHCQPQQAVDSTAELTASASTGTPYPRSPLMI
jgi:hypothetical protein